MALRGTVKNITALRMLYGGLIGLGAAIVASLIAFPVSLGGFNVKSALSILSVVAFALVVTLPLIIMGLKGFREKVMFHDLGIECNDNTKHIFIEWDELKEIGMIMHPIYRHRNTMYFCKVFLNAKNELSLLTGREFDKIITVTVNKKLIELMPWILTHYSRDFKNPGQTRFSSELAITVYSHNRYEAKIDEHGNPIRDLPPSDEIDLPDNTDDEAIDKTTETTENDEQAPPA